MKRSALVTIAASAVLLAACQQGGPGVMNGGSGLNKQDLGTAVGAIGGGVLGSTMGGGHGKIATTIAGTLIGGFLGNQVGQSLDNADRAAAEHASQQALETGQPGQSLPWRGQNASGTVTPGAYTQNANGQYCREYTQTVNIGGKTQHAYGTACRQPDGSWQVTNSNSN